MLVNANASLEVDCLMFTKACRKHNVKMSKRTMSLMFVWGSCVVMCFIYASVKCLTPAHSPLFSSVTDGVNSSRTEAVADVIKMPYANICGDF